MDIPDFAIFGAIFGAIIGFERLERTVCRHFKAIGAIRVLRHAPVIFMAAVMVAVMAAPDTLAQGAGDATVESRQVIAVVPRAWPPQYSVDENGKPAGFAIDVMDAVAKRAGLSVKYIIKNTWTEVSETLRDGKADIIPNLGISDKRKSYAVFTSPVEAFRISLFARAGSMDLADLSDLSGRTVGAVEFNVAVRLLKPRLGPDLQIFPSFQEALFSLLSGTVDFIAFPEPVALKLARAASVDNRIMIVGAPLLEVKRAIAVRKDLGGLYQAVETAVVDLIGSPAYQAIYVKWYGTPKPFWTTLRVALATAASLLALIIIMAWWRYRSVVHLNQALQRTITGRKQTEDALNEKSALLETTLNNIAQGFCVYDGNQKLVAYNKEYVEMGGFPEGFIHLGIDQRKVVRFLAEQGNYGEGDIDKLVEERISYLTTQEGLPVERLRPNNKYYLVTRKPMPDGGFVGTFTDITKSKMTEEDLRTAKEQAELSNITKSQFLATMSHELRTPLNAIIGFSEMISGGIYGPIGDSRYLEYLNYINDSGKHLLTLITDILDVSRVEAGRVELDEEEIDIVSAMDTVGRLISEMAKEGRIDIETLIDGSPPLLWADDRRVKQILLNLMTNAVKFTPEGGKITVKAGVTDDGAVQFSITDTGIGIAAEDISKVMESFRQVDNSLTRKHEGTGLGLPLAKSFVELHGGSLDLQSKIGHGTTVTVTFPNSRSRHVALGRQPQLN